MAGAFFYDDLSVVFILEDYCNRRI